MARAVNCKMVKTKSVYDPVEESDGQRILVSRYWPRGLSRERLSLTEHLKDAAPSVELLQDWKKGNISWDEYKNRYYKEMAQQHETISKLAKMVCDKTITLLCLECEEDPHCHRHLLKDVVEKFK